MLHVRIQQPPRLCSRLERSPRMRKVECSYSNRYWPSRKIGSDSSTVIRSAQGVSVTCSRRWPLSKDVLYHSRCGMLKNPHAKWAWVPSIGQMWSQSPLKMTSPSEWDAKLISNTRYQNVQSSNSKFTVSINVNYCTLRQVIVISWGAKILLYPS